MSCLGHLQEGIAHVCRVCGTELTDENWYPCEKKHGRHICKRCLLAHRSAFTKANLKTHCKYLGVVTCPKCGKKGYKVFYYHINENLGTIYKGDTEVQHQHTKHGKTIHDGVCYIGMGQV